MLLHKNYIDYSSAVISKLFSLNSASASELHSMELFLNEMETHIDNSMDEAISHNSAYGALADLMEKHPRNFHQPMHIKRWAADVIYQLNKMHAALKQVKKHLGICKTMNTTKSFSHLKEELAGLFEEIKEYAALSVKFVKSLAKEEAEVDHLDYQHVKAEVINMLKNKKHLSEVYVNNITSWF